MLQILRSLERQVTPLALDFYDRFNPTTLIDRIARVRNTSPGQKKVTMQWWAAFPQLRQWIGERKTQRAYDGSLEFEIKPYEITMDYDRDDVEAEDALISAADLAQSIGEAFALGKVMLAYRPLRDNVLAHDGQQFFDTDHVHPDDSLYSNLFTAGVDFAARGQAGQPTVVEARNEFKLAMAKLIENTLIRTTLIRTTDISRQITVITRNHEVWSAYNDLLTEEEINGEPNRFRGSFELLRDFDPLAGTEAAVDFIHSVPGGPRPVVFLPAREPRGVVFDTSKEFSSRYIPFGMDARYGAGPAFPQPAVRLTE